MAETQKPCDPRISGNPNGGFTVNPGICPMISHGQDRGSLPQPVNVQTWGEAQAVAARMQRQTPTPPGCPTPKPTQ